LRLRTFAIENLTNYKGMDAVERILLGREFSVSHWIKSGYKDLIVQYEPLTPEQADKIGSSLAVRIFRARENATPRSGEGQCPSCRRTVVMSGGVASTSYCGNCNKYVTLTNLTLRCDTNKVNSLVDTEFAAEISQANNDGAAYQSQ
jgi:hypothetical protein